MIPRYLLSFNTEFLPTLECEVLVVGSGVAGLSAALSLSETFRVLLITKSELQVSTTSHAQGGIAAVMDERDTPESHIRDTLVAGVGLSDTGATEILVREGPERIRELLDFYQANFDMDGDRLDLAIEGGHSNRRVVHARGDATGSEVENALMLALLKEARAQVKEHTFMVDILLDDGRCIGALAVDTGRNALVAIRARAVILASGGMGQVYLVTTNPPICTGDGMAMAFRAGARVSDVEFVQFHPTALHIPEQPKYLISEAVRGEGARLVDAEGNSVMEGVHPLGDLAPRDVVVARMFEVMKEQQTNHLYLETRHMGPDKLKRRFPNIYEHCMQAGIDVTRYPIPVSPAAHYMSGGVLTDLWGRTDIPGLLACGEVACTGVHGANRLASNSLLEGLVFARRISGYLAEHLDEGARWPRGGVAYPGKGEVQIAGSEARIGTGVREDLLTGNLREVMLDSVGIMRSEKVLKESLEFLRENVEVLDVEYLGKTGMELKNMYILSMLITTAALLRTESRGCHRRRDFPEIDDWNWRKHIDMILEDGEIRIEMRAHRKNRGDIEARKTV